MEKSGIGKMAALSLISNSRRLRMKKIEQVKSVKKVRILVVEDERIVSMDIQRRLKALGYEVVGAAVSGEEAIEKAGIHRPNLVLMDIMLDGQLDGIAAAEAIRAQYRIP